MELKTCPFCQSDVLTIYGNEKIRCNGCGVGFSRPANGSESILDIWMRLGSTSVHVPSPLLQNSPVAAPVTSNDVDDSLVDVDFGDVDEV